MALERPANQDELFGILTQALVAPAGHEKAKLTRQYCLLHKGSDSQVKVELMDAKVTDVLDSLGPHCDSTQYEAMLYGNPVVDAKALPVSSSPVVSLSQKEEKSERKISDDEKDEGDLLTFLAKEHCSSISPRLRDYPQKIRKNYQKYEETKDLEIKELADLQYQIFQRKYPSFPPIFSKLLKSEPISNADASSCLARWRTDDERVQEDASHYYWTQYVPNYYCEWKSLKKISEEQCNIFRILLKKGAAFTSNTSLKSFVPIIPFWKFNQLKNNPHLYEAIYKLLQKNHPNFNIIYSEYLTERIAEDWKNSLYTNDSLAANASRIRNLVGHYRSYYIHNVYIGTGREYRFGVNPLYEQNPSQLLEDAKSIARRALKHSSFWREESTSKHYQEIAKLNTNFDNYIPGHSKTIAEEAKKAVEELDTELKEKINRKSFKVGLFGRAGIPKHIQEQLDVIQHAKKTDATNPRAYVEALSEIRIIAREALESRPLTRHKDTTQYYERVRRMGLKIK